MSMLYIKVLKDDTVVAVEAHPSPVYVYKQANGVLARCTERKSQGILSIDGGTVYQLYDKEALEDVTLTAMVITTTEYLVLVDTLDNEKVEDTTPGETENPDEQPEEKVMNIAEMRRRILTLESALEEQLIINGAQMERNDFLESCLLEMSEIVYG